MVKVDIFLNIKNSLNYIFSHEKIKIILKKILRDNFILSIIFQSLAQYVVIY